MDCNFINSALDADTMTQQGFFSHQLNEYEKIYGCMDGIAAESTEFNELRRKTSGTSKPLAEFVKAVLDLIENPTAKDTLIKNLMDKSGKQQKFDYCLFFIKVALDFNPQNLYALDLRAITLKKIDAPVEEQKEAMKAYLDQDFNDTHYLMEISAIHMAENKTDKAVVDLKRAVQRAIKKHDPLRQDFQELKTTSLALDAISDEKDKVWLVGILSRAKKTMDPGKVNSILSELERRNHELTDYSVITLKEMLKTDPKNSRTRGILAGQYKASHDNSERAETCIKLSGLADDNCRDTLQAIESFEKMVMLDKGTFVSHATYGLGRITDVNDTCLTIDFIRKKNHKMSVGMALKSLEVLFKNHITVLKTFANREKLKAKITGNTRWALETLIKSGANTLKLMKAELTLPAGNAILSAEEFSKFQESAKKIIKSDNYITPLPNDGEKFEVRDTPLTYEEKKGREFKSERELIGKFKVFRTFLRDEGDRTSDSFKEMFEYFTKLMPVSTCNASQLAVHLFMCELARSKFKIENIKNCIHLSDSEVYAATEADKTDCFDSIKDKDLKENYVKIVRKFDSNWEDTLATFYMREQMPCIEKIFEKEKHDDSFIKDMMRRSVLIKNSKPEFYIHFLRIYPDRKDWSGIYNTDIEFMRDHVQVLNTLRKDSGSKALLDGIMDYIRSCENPKTDSSPLYNYVRDSLKIDDRTKSELIHLLCEKDPDLLKSKIDENKDNAYSIPRELLCKQETYDRKKAEFDNIMNVEIPKNREEIAKARDLGDLKENSEYQYAKDKQKLLNTTINDLDEEISRAMVVRQNDIDSSKVSFGCRIDITNGGKSETYTVLGPWESDPAKNIISYSSPLGKSLYGHKAGERLSFKIGETDYNIEIVRISAEKL